MPEEDLYTKDGTLDFRGNPAKRRLTGMWKACAFILVHECFGGLVYDGLSRNLVVYFKNKIGQNNSDASISVANWTGTCYITPLIGAFVADEYIGRYWSIVIFLIIYTLGMVLLVLSASIPGLKPSGCEVETGLCHATKTQTSFFYVALYMVALGQGGLYPCIASFGADQFDENDKLETTNRSSFFNWMYFWMNVGTMIACTILVWVQMNVNWQWGFGIPAMLMIFVVVPFILGTRFYRYQKPNGSPITQVCKVLVASLSKYKVRVPEDVNLLHEIIDVEGSNKRLLQRTKNLSFFDKAAVIIEEENLGDSPTNPWRLCTVTQVEELKAMIRLIPIWATGITFACVYCQIDNFFVLQGLSMDPNIGIFNIEIPAASLSFFNTLGVIICTPIYDRMIVPFIRRFTRHKDGLSQLQRMGTGLFISIVAVLCAGILEFIRLQYVKRHNYYDLEQVPISILWQVPQYFIVGCAEVFVLVGQLDFFYEQAPHAMRSICSALGFTTLAMGNFMCTLMVTLVTRITSQNGNGNGGWIQDNLNYGHLDYYYYLLVVLSLLNLVVFLGLSKWYTYKTSISLSS